MPEISRFFGIVIAMFADDHNPPHFHVRYGNYNATITIDKAIIKGEMPNSVIKKVVQWMEEHPEEIMDNWNRLQNGEPALPIKPLK